MDTNENKFTSIKHVTFVKVLGLIPLFFHELNNKMNTKTSYICYVKVSISPTFYKQLLRQDPFAKKSYKPKL